MTTCLSTGIVPPPGSSTTVRVPHIYSSGTVNTWRCIVRLLYYLTDIHTHLIMGTDVLSHDLKENICGRATNVHESDNGIHMLHTAWAAGIIPQIM